MQTTTLLILCAVAASCSPAPPPLQMTDAQLEQVLTDRPTMQRHLKCATGEGPCDPVGRRLRTLAPLVLRGACPQCSAQEARQIRRTLAYVQRNYPWEWAKIVRQYDLPHASAVRGGGGVRGADAGADAGAVAGAVADAAAAGVGLGHRRGSQRQTLHPEAAQVRARRGALRPHREEIEDLSAVRAARGVSAVHPTGDQADPTHALVRAEKLSPAVGEDRAPIRRLKVLN